MPKNKSSAAQKRLDLLILISIAFAAYGLIQSFLLTHQDCYALTFAWISFSIIWTIIAIIRYQNLSGRC